MSAQLLQTCENELFCLSCPSPWREGKSLFSHNTTEGRLRCSNDEFCQILRAGNSSQLVKTEICFLVFSALWIRASIGSKCRFTPGQIGRVSSLLSLVHLKHFKPNKWLLNLFVFVTVKGIETDFLGTLRKMKPFFLTPFQSSHTSGYIFQVNPQEGNAVKYMCRYILSCVIY